MENRTENNSALAVQTAQSNNLNLFAFASIDRAWGFCTKLAESRIIPDSFQSNPASCLIALDMANRTRRNPLEVMQAMYVVHGKPGFSASFLIGLINSCGLFERLKFEFVGKEGTEDWGCRAWTVEKSTGDKLVGPTVTMKMARMEGWINNKKWSTMPEAMLRYRAASFFSRSYCPEITGGMHSVEELSDSNPADEGVTVMRVQQPTQKAASMEAIMNASVPASAKQEPQKITPKEPEAAAPVEATEPAPAENPYKRGLLPLELMREEVQKLLGPDGLDLRPDEQEEYLARITGERSLKKIPEAGLKAVAAAAQDDIARRDAEER